MTHAANGRASRRSFLACCASAGFVSPALSTSLWAQSRGGAETITAEMVDHAARLVGLTIAPADREEMLAGLRSNIESYRSLRALHLDQAVPPPLYFNPAVPGQRFETEQQPLEFGDAPEEVRPDSLNDVAFWSVSRLSELVRSRQVSATELTDLYLQRLSRLDASLNSVVTLTAELALEQAATADRELESGRRRGPLHGIPWGAKDLLAKAGYRTTWGFEAYRDQVIDMDATVVERLEAAGAVLVAKLSTGEIARGDRWFGGQTKNPWKPDEGSGGSSAGPAAATAAGFVGFSIGTDTTGSIIGPSRNCGITGLRPSFGRVSRHGVMPVCWSLDKVGPMCRSAADCALVFSAIYGPDDQDLAVVDYPFNWNARADVRRLTVGVLSAAFEAEPSSSAARRNDLAVLDVLRDLGVETQTVVLPEHAAMDPLQMLLVDEAAAFDELILAGKEELFFQEQEDPEDRLMRIARLHPAVEYLQIQRRRMLLMQGMAQAFEGIDVLVAPFDGSPVQNATSLTGHPAVSVPNGFDEAGKPTAIQFIGRMYGEADALLLAHAFQLVTDHHRKRPPLLS